MGTLIRELREEAGLSIRELARRARVDKAGISRVESGEQKTLSAENLARVAQQLGTSVEELRRKVANGGPRPPRRDWPTFRQWLDRDPNLTDAQRDLLEGFYRELSRRR